MVPSLCVRLAPVRGRSQSEPGSEPRVTSMRIMSETHMFRKHKYLFTVLLQAFSLLEKYIVLDQAVIDFWLRY